MKQTKSHVGDAAVERRLLGVLRINPRCTRLIGTRGTGCRQWYACNAEGCVWQSRSWSPKWGPTVGARREYSDHMTWHLAAVEDQSAGASRTISSGGGDTPFVFGGDGEYLRKERSRAR